MTHPSQFRPAARRLAPVLTLSLALASAAQAVTYYVAPPPAGSNANPGSSASPWATLQFASNSVDPGDTVIVRAGQYAGFEVETVASQALPIVFRAAPGEIVELISDVPGRGVGVNVENAAWITIEGFRSNGRAVAGFRVVESPHVTLRGNVAQDNGTWGILTGCADDVVIEGNLTSGSEDEHGIYVSNSGDRPIIRGNVVYGNQANGIHMNGDIETTCTGITFDGVISQAVVEGNLIYDNGVAGGSGINCDGVQNSVIRNNVIWNAHHSGISLYQIDGGQPANGNRILGNTVHTSSSGRWAVNIMDGSINTIIRDNILYCDQSFRGAISVCATCMTGLQSDRNATENVFSIDEGDNAITLAQWRTATGQDMNSFVATPASLVVSAATGNYRLLSNSLAINAGTAHAELTRDHEGLARPQGANHDIGAFESAGAGTVSLFRDGFDAGSVVRWSDSAGAGPF